MGRQTKHDLGHDEAEVENGTYGEGAVMPSFAMPVVMRVVVVLVRHEVGIMPHRRAIGTIGLAQR
jgi:hypothetical protein